MAQIEDGEDIPIAQPKEGKTMPASTTVIGLVNGMLGGTCLVLPEIGIYTGWITTIWVCLVVGLISWITAKAMITHLGKGKQIRDTILAHFKNDPFYLKGYSFVMWFSFVFLLIIYFQIICLQIDGLLGYKTFWVGPGVAVMMTAVVLIIRICHIGEEILAYGIISIITYVLFLLWAHLTTPAGPKVVPASGPPYQLASALFMAYSIHDFLIQNILKNPKREQYQGIVNVTFLIGTLAYTYMALGSFAIVNRKSYVKNPQIMTDYFTHGQWQMVVLQVLYMGHMISAFPNFLINSKIRFFQMCGFELYKKLTLKEVIYILVFVLVCFLVFATNARLQFLINIEGAIVGYTYVVIIPIWIHLKCVWYDKSSGTVEGDEERNSQIKPNFCQCENHYRSKFTLYAETAFMILALVFGFALMVYILSTFL